MSSEHGHEENDGAHEIDKMPYGRLFNLLIGLSALTLLSCIGVIQIFNLQVRQIVEDYAAEGEKHGALADYRAEAVEVGAGFGAYEFELEGKAERRYFVPVANAKKQVIDDAKLLEGAASYRGWEETPVGKQIKDWGGLPTPPKPATPPPGVKGVPADGKAPAPAPADGKAPADGNAPADGKAPAPADDKKGDEKKEPQTRGEKKEPGTGTGTGTAPSAGEAKAGPQ